MSGDFGASEQPLPVQPFIPGRRPRRLPGPFRRGLLKTPAWVLTLVFILPALWLLSLDLPQKPHVNWIQGLGHILLLLALYVTGALQRLKILHVLLMIALAAGMVLLHWQVGGWLLGLGLAYPFAGEAASGGVPASGNAVLWFVEVGLPILVIGLAEMLLRRRAGWRCLGWIALATVAATVLILLAHESLYRLRWLMAPPDAEGMGMFRWYGPAFAVLRAFATWSLIPLAFDVAERRPRNGRRVLGALAAGSAVAATLLFVLLPIVPPGGFTISAETTGLDVPLGADGRPDYIALLNRKYGDGVTPENNAAVPLLRAMGPAAIYDSDEPALRAKVTERVGMEPLAEDGEYFVDIETYLESVIERLSPGTRPTTGPAKALQDRLNGKWQDPPIFVLKERTSAPWKAADDPHVAAWLERNERPLNLFLSAAERTRYFVPQVADDGLPCMYAAGSVLPGYPVSASEAVVVRAMLRLSEGKADMAHEQFLALHRIARRLGQGRKDDVLAGAGVEYVACKGDYALAVSGRLTAAQARAYAADLAKLPPLPDIMPALREFRTEKRDAVVAVNRDPRIAMRIGFNPLGFKDRGPTADQVDWDESLRIINEFHDRRWRFAADETFDGSTGREAFRRDNTVWYLDRSMRYKDGQCVWLVLRAHAYGPRSVRLLATDMATETFIPGYLPLTCRWKLIVDCARAKTGLAILATAVEAYRLGRGKLPETLDALIPEYLDAMPAAHFGTRSPSYVVKGETYELTCGGWFYDGPEDDVTPGP